MEQTRTYKVESPVAGFQAGATVTADDLPAGLNVEALVAGGFLSVESASLIACPACAEQGVERKAKSPETLAKHYAKDHPGLEPPKTEEE